MSGLNARDYIYLVWKDTVTRKQFIIAQLSKNGQYEFSYGFEVKEAIKSGFKPLISFEDIHKTYTSDVLFSVFSSRLPDKKRKDMQEILQKYNLEEYDEYRLLKRSGAKLPIDNLEFIDPILDTDYIKVERFFYLAGVRHYLSCNGEDCEKSEILEVGEKLNLVLEPENIHDKYAIKVFGNSNTHVGYIPRYYSENLTKLIKEGCNCSCYVVEINKDNYCSECVKVRFALEK